MMNFKLFLFVVIKYTDCDFAFNSAIQKNNSNTVVFLDDLSSTHTVI